MGSLRGVVVVGSANVDVVYRVERIPGPGETVLSHGSSTAAGGKGQNQAVAAARAGAATLFVGAVGTDDGSEFTLKTMTAAGIDASLVRRIDGPTGTAIIAVDDSGENSIIVDAGANAHLIELTEHEREAISGAAVVVAQLEISLEAVTEAAVVSRASGSTFVLNAAPVRDLPPRLLQLVDVLVVNEHEAAHLGVAKLGLPCVITTLGGNGSTIRTADGSEVRLSATKAHVVDTTGAGDTFVGVLAAELAGGLDVVAAATRATVAAAISVERAGAVPSIPTRAEVDARLSD